MSLPPAPSSRPHLGQLLVPAGHVHADELEDAGQRGQDLLGDVVGGVEAQAAVLQHLQGAPHQLDEGHARRPVHHHVGNPLSHTRFQTPVVRHHTPGEEEGGREGMRRRPKFINSQSFFPQLYLNTMQKQTHVSNMCIVCLQTQKNTQIKHSFKCAHDCNKW